MDKYYLENSSSRKDTSLKDKMLSCLKITAIVCCEILNLMFAIQFILYLLLLVYLYYVCFFIVGWSTLKTHKTSIKLNRFPTISIVIPVRNEEDFIAALLIDIQKQTYPANLIDVIVVDDDSTDGTVEVIKKLNFQNVRVLSLHIDAEIVAYKKKAITLGVENSNAELIITTDGDCRVGENWISTIVDFYLTHNVKLISSPVSFHNENNWFEKIQILEFQYLIGAAGACIKNGMPNTCNGANLAYTREVFKEANGYEGLDEIASGDDEMFLQKISKLYPTGVGFLKSKEAIVYTYAKSYFSEFLQQRKRWASKTSKYINTKVSVMVVCIFLYNLSLVLSLPFMFTHPEIRNYVFISISLKLIFDGVFFLQTLYFFNKIKLFPYVLLVEFFYSFYIVFIGIWGSSRTSYIWKNRKVK